MKNFILTQKKLIEAGISTKTIEELKALAEKYLLPSEIEEIFGEE